MTHPYSQLNDYNFWSRAVTLQAPGLIDPVVKPNPIAKGDKVATMGSCFAQHLSRNMAKAGFNYFIAEEPPPGLSTNEAASQNYGVFSARYGNVYTARQAVQLFDRAYGHFVPRNDIWHKESRFVDAFRPQIQPGGFLTEEALRTDRQQHLACVRKVFEESDWLIFTLGLTEAWCSRSDHSVYPVAPGVSGGEYVPSEYEFVNFSASEVIADLRELIEKTCSVNRRLRFILTVSPVPLIATYEDRHVLVSTTASKAALRVAADVVERAYEQVIYFPSYEIITSPANGGRYFADDLRQVTDIGVSHVMRIFFRHFLSVESEQPALRAPLEHAVASEPADIICDEEEIERAVRMSGF